MTTARQHHPEDMQCKNASIDPKSVSKEIIVDFEGSNDLEDPNNRSRMFKWTVVIILAFLNGMVQFATVVQAPVTPKILQYFNIEDKSSLYLPLTVSIWEIGELVAPLIVAPLSELYGRLWVYHITNILFVCFSVGAALSQNIHVLIAFRFLNGMAAATPTLNPSVIGDMFSKEQRGGALSVLSAAVLMGPVLGPIVGSALANADSWQWTFWFVAIVNGFFSILFVLVYRETYKVTILKRRAKRLRLETGNQNIRSKYDTGETPAHVLRKSIFRPLTLLFTCPTLFSLSLYLSIVYGYLFTVITLLGSQFEKEYAAFHENGGLSYLGLGIGMTLSIFLCRYLLDVHVRRALAKSREMTPEQRLPLTVVGGMVLPVGLFIYGWTLEAHTHWMIPIIGTAILGFGFVAISVSAVSYLVDAFGIHSASAVAAKTVLQEISGSLIPLAGPTLYERLGFGWGNSVLGFIALALVPLPLLMMLFGSKLRERDKTRIQE